MAQGRGRPPKPTAIDDDLMAAARKALLQIAGEMQVPTARYPDTSTKSAAPPANRAPGAESGGSGCRGRGGAGDARSRAGCQGP